MVEKFNLIPKEGLTLDKFFYKDMEDLAIEIVKSATNHYEKSTLKDRGFQRAQIAFSTIKLNLKAATTVFCFLGEEIVAMMRFVQYDNPPAPLSNDIVILAAFSGDNKYRHSKIMTEGVCRFIFWLHEKDIIKQCGAVDWQEKVGNYWRKSEWCKGHNAGFLPRDVFVLKQISDNERVILEIYKNIEIRKSQEEFDVLFKPWNWPKEEKNK